MAKDVIIACDFPSGGETLAFLEQFETERPFVKIGMELFYGAGPDIVRAIHDRGHPIFLDLKLCDIPNTVKSAMRVLRDLGADMVNLHAFGTRAMMEAALEGLTRPDGSRPLLIAVTQLTSTDKQSMELYNMIKHYQPNCLINSRIGNGVGDYHACGDNQVNFSTTKNKLEVKTGLYECPVTTMDSWGYKADCQWKTPEDLKAVQNRLNAQGINYLLNIGPDHLGRLPKPAVDILKKMREL
jgi:hypothetical protein